MVIDKLIDKIIEKKNPCCVGIDPDYEKIPNCYKEEGLTKTQVIYNWAIDVIDGIKDTVAAIKPQIAFFEMYGSEGIKILEEIIRYAHKNDLIVIDDSKRNDIGNTARAYAYAHLDDDGPINADFLTVSPFLGTDSLEPFIEKANENEKGLFILVKTSNPSSKQISEAIKDDNSIMNFLAEYVNKKGNEIIGEYGYSSIGAVVGATFPKEAKELRKIMKNNIFLVPGYGAQGGSVDDIINCFNDDGLGAIVSSSRGILYSYIGKNNNFTKEDYIRIVVQSTIEMRGIIYSKLKEKYNYIKY